MYLITNVLDPQRLPRAAAGRLYRLRWGVEVFYRSFKQTLQKRKMSSTSPQMARLELTWSLIGLLVLGLLNVRMLIARGIDPLQASVGNAIKIMRQAMRHAQSGADSGGDVAQIRSTSWSPTIRAPASAARRDHG